MIAMYSYPSDAHVSTIAAVESRAVAPRGVPVEIPADILARHERRQSSVGRRGDFVVAVANLRGNPGQVERRVHGRFGDADARDIRSRVGPPEPFRLERPSARARENGELLEVGHRAGEMEERRAGGLLSGGQRMPICTRSVSKYRRLGPRCSV